MNVYWSRTESNRYRLDVVKFGYIFGKYLDDYKAGQAPLQAVQSGGVIYSHKIIES